MEKKQYEICIEVLKKLEQKKVLGYIILIGSWCVYFYKYYFENSDYNSFIRTRDIDFLVPIPFRLKEKVDVKETLEDLGFVVDFRGSKGYIRLIHPDLFVEFLVPERGRGLDKPYPLPQLGLNAQALRFLDFLAKNTIHLKAEGVPINLPHPANFALHKLIIFQRRRNPDKVAKDKESAIRILKALIDKGEQDSIKKVFSSVPQKWQRRIVKGLEKAEEKEILRILEVK